MTDHKNEFHVSMLNIYYKAKQYCNYNPTRFHQMVQEHGGVETAKRLLATPDVQVGLTTLWECGRLDLSMEALVIDPRFEELFSAEEREIARERLVAYGWEE